MLGQPCLQIGYACAHEMIELVRLMMVHILSFVGRGANVRMEFFILVFLSCSPSSQYVSHDVPKFPMCFPRVFPITFVASMVSNNDICIGIKYRTNLVLVNTTI